MKEILLNSTILIHIANNADDNNSKAFKASIKLMKQIFNLSTDAVRKKLLDEFIIFYQINRMTLHMRIKMELSSESTFFS